METKQPDMDEATFKELCEAWDREAGPHSAEDALRFAYLLAMETKQPEGDADEPEGVTLGETMTFLADGQPMVVTGPIDRIADSMERAVTLLEEIHAAIQPQEEADEVLDPDAGLVTIRATTKDGVARCYVVRTESTSAAIEAACSAWECEWADLVQKSVEMEE